MQRVTRTSNLSAIYPGSFDPLTLGHLEIIERAHEIFEKVVVVVAQASDKQYFFKTYERVEMIREATRHLTRVEVEAHSGLTVEFARARSPSVLLRGIRNMMDIEYERMIQEANRKLAPEIDTVFLFARPEYSSVSSTLIKEIAQHGGDLTGLVPQFIAAKMKKRER